MSTELQELLRLAESKGWNAASYQHAAALIENGQSLSEDDRVADWKYLLPGSCHGGVALVLGSGFGTVPVSLSGFCSRVYVVDVTWEKVRLLALRCIQYGIQNIVPIHVSHVNELPFRSQCFDLVVLRSAVWNIGDDRSRRGSASFASTARQVFELLVPGGVAFWGVGNRFGYQRLIRPWRVYSGSEHSMRSYRRLLQVVGFSKLQFYAPLPRHDGIPLFYLPLAHGGPIQYFLRRLFRLFDAVSPEVKRQYTLDYTLAKIGVRVALLLGLTTWARHLVPGFGIMTTRDPSRSARLGS